MEFNLEQLGITKIRVESMVVDTIVERMYDEVESSCLKQVSKYIVDTVQARIDTSIDDLIKLSLNEIYQPIDEYGNPNGSKTTLRAMFLNSTRTWWDTNVDHNGRVLQRSHYGAKSTRAEWIADKLFKDALEKDLQNDFNKFVKEAVNEAKKELPQAIAKIVKSTWR